MNKEDITIIICCAGMGTRLGIGSTKAVININGKPLIIRILELLRDYTDIRIVVGYQAEKVIEVVTKYRKDVMFVFNYEYESTGIIQSVNKALPYSRKYIVEIDGDLVINPKDFEKFMAFPGECLGINYINSSNPVYIRCNKNQVIELSNSCGDYEWTGLLKVRTDRISNKGRYLYEAIRTMLPLHYIEVDARDIDTAEDYENTLKWIQCEEE